MSPPLVVLGWFSYGSLAEGMGCVWVVMVASMCLKQVTSVPSPVPHNLNTAQGDAHPGRGGFPHFSASPVTWSKVFPAPVVWLEVRCNYAVCLGTCGQEGRQNSQKN